MDLNSLLRKIDRVEDGTVIYIDAVYKVDRAYFDEDGILSIEAYHFNKLTIFNIDRVDNVFSDYKIGVAGGDEMFIIEFVK